MKLPVGIYEALLSRDQAKAIAELEALSATEGPLTSDTAPGVLAHYLKELAFKAFKNVRGDEKLFEQLQLANRLLQILADTTPESGIDEGDHVDEPARMLLSIKDPKENRLGTCRSKEATHMVIRWAALPGPRHL
jgi:hypothetical protein